MIPFNDNKPFVRLPIRILVALDNLADFRKYLKETGYGFNSSSDNPLTSEEISLVQVLTTVLAPIAEELIHIRKILESR